MRFINFQDVIKDDDQFNKGSISLTKVQPNKMNISQQILGAKISEELKKSHDASYDADLLSRVCRGYMKSWSYAIDLKSYMIPSREYLQIAQLVVGRLIQKRIRSNVVRSRKLEAKRDWRFFFDLRTGNGSGHGPEGKILI